MICVEVKKNINEQTGIMTCIFDIEINKHYKNFRERKLKQLLDFHLRV
jgi:hypothetical protein